MAVTWPSVLKPTSVGFWLENISRTGGVALNGQEQTVGSGTERWRAALQIPIRNNEQVLEARTFLVRLRGRGVAALVPAFDGRRAPWPVDEWGRTLSPCFTRERQLDGTVYEYPEIPPESAITVDVETNPALGDTAMTVNFTQGSALKAGQYFSLSDHLYLIEGVGAVIGGFQSIVFRPPLRTNPGSGDAMELARPVCSMKMLADDQMRMELDLSRFASLTLEFREDF